MSDERPSDALQPAPKKRMGEGQGRREDPEDDGPSHDPGTWAAASDAARERRRVHVRRGGNTSGAGTDQQALAATLPGEAQAHASAANAFAGVDLIAAPQASANPFANVSLTAPSIPSIPFAGVQLTPPLASAEDKQQEIPEAESKTGAQPDAPLAASADTTVEAAEAASNTTPPAEAHGTEVAPAAAASTTAKDKGESKTEAAPAPATSATAPGTNANIFGSAYSAGAFGGFGTSAAGSGSGGFGGLSSGGFGGFGAAAAASGGAGAGGFGGLGGFQAGFGGFGTTGSGFGFNAGASTGSNSSPPGGLHVPAAQAEENENPEAECEAAFKPVCELPPPPEKKVTGEEDETTEFSVNGKLYEFDAPKQQWRERGTGEFKINVGSRGARLVMRATGNLRLLLNAKLYAGMPTQPMSGQVGVTFACINAAAPSDPSASEASKALDTGASSGGAASVDVPGGASKQAPVTYAVRLKSPERMTALLEALEKAKAERCVPSASAKGNGGDVEAGVF